MFKSLVLLLCCSLPISVFAHGLIGNAYVVGGKIEGEVQYSSGHDAEAGTKVLVFDKDGKSLGSTVIDEQSNFTFQVQQAVDHYFKIDLGSGHVLQLKVEADELSGDFGSTSESTNKALNLQIEQAVAKQVIPLRKELAAYRHQVFLRDILGGIGYILGLVAISLICLRKKQQA